MGDRQERKKSIWGGMFKGSKNKGEASEMTPLNQTSAATGRGKSKIDLLLLLFFFFLKKIVTSFVFACSCMFIPFQINF